MAVRPSRMAVSQRAKPAASAVRASSSCSASSLASEPIGQPPAQSRWRWMSMMKSRHAYSASKLSRRVSMGSWMLRMVSVS
jgi:hypothetical protein